MAPDGAQKEEEGKENEEKGIKLLQLLLKRKTYGAQHCKCPKMAQCKTQTQNKTNGAKKDHKSERRKERGEILDSVLTPSSFSSNSRSYEARIFWAVIVVVVVPMKRIRIIVVVVVVVE